MYDPALGRWHVVDPLTEWHFNATPYHYCFNNPVKFIDPTGMDTTYNVIEPLPEVTVSATRPKWIKRVLSKIGRALSAADEAVAGNSTYEKEGGIHGTGSNGGGNENSTAKNPDSESVDMDLILAINPKAGSLGGKTSLHPVRMKKSIDSGIKAGKKIQEMASDKEIVESRTGPSEKRTASANQPVPSTAQKIDTVVNPFDSVQGVPISKDGIIVNSTIYKNDTLISDTTVNGWFLK